MNLQDFVVDAVKAVEFKLIRERSDVEEKDNGFPPEMAHQIFGENENIFGYSNLKINIFYSAGPLDIYYDVKFSKKVDDIKGQGVLKADDVHTAVTEVFPEGCYYSDIDEFLRVADIKNQSFETLGEKINEFTIKNRNFEIYLCDSQTPNFLKYHSRLETFVYWFIDAASKIELDENWKFFLIFEKFESKDGATRYASVGFSSVYLYFSYPDKIRPRISQALVLPPFQNMGIGTKLIETIYEHFQKQERVTDITVEDGSEEFQRIRCTIDVKLCKDLECFKPEKLKGGMNNEMLQETKQKFKITPKQCRVIYEILRLAKTDKKNSTEYKNYRLEVKKRLNMNYLKQKRDLKKVLDRGVKVDPEKLMMVSAEERIEQLNGEYMAAEEYYEHILRKAGLIQ